MLFNTRRHSFLSAKLLKNTVWFLSILPAGAVSAQSQPALIPAPVIVKTMPGKFMLRKKVSIYTESALTRTASFLSTYLKNQCHVSSRIIQETKIPVVLPAGAIVLTSANTATLPESGYRLTISEKRVTIAGRGAGAFYGLQSFMQSVQLQKKEVPALFIEDYPRFEYRGIMLDVSRHFFNVAYVKRLLDLMAFYKLNKFHWHLVDNEGWRIEIKKYPKLTSVGAYRQLTGMGGNRDWPDQVNYGGFYTQDEIKDVVKYAAERHIEVIPEIEMPAHSMAALRTYPELKCEQPKPGTNPAPFDIIYKPSEETFHFLEDVLTEIMPLFPSKYIHIGGDEANKKPWEDSPFCQQLMRQLGLKDTRALQSYFIQRIEKFVNLKGKTIIGWDEILEGGLAPNATVMSWRGEEGGIAAARQRHNVIMTPAQKGMYFDYYQSSSPQEPVEIGGLSPIALTYSYNPVPDSLNATQQTYIKGMQANLWTEFISTPEKADYMLLPRMLAVAEAAWTPLNQKDFKNFNDVRLPQHLSLLDAEGYNYRVPTAIGVKDTTLLASTYTFTLTPSVPGANIYYTLNGHIPDNTDLKYCGPLTLNIPVNETRELRTVVITASGKRSVATHTIVSNLLPLTSVAVTSPQSGLLFKRYANTVRNIDQMAFALPVDSGITQEAASKSVRNGKAAAYKLEGYFKADADGDYVFTLSSNTICRLEVGGRQLIDDSNNTARPPFFVANGAVKLSRGYHQIKVWFIDPGNADVNLTVSAPGAAHQLYH